VIGVSVQDVQISGFMTGSHVGAYPLALLTDEGSPKVLFWGLDIRGVFFSWVLHFLDKQKRSASPLEGETKSQTTLMTKIYTDKCSHIF
jgi:hypothetical protein